MTEDVLRLVSERAAALAAQDWAVVDAQLHPRFIYTNSQGQRLGKRATWTSCRRAHCVGANKGWRRPPSCTWKAPPCSAGSWWTIF